MSISIVAASVALACTGPDPQSGQWSPPTPTQNGAVTGEPADTATPTVTTDNPGNTTDDSGNPAEPTATEPDASASHNPTATPAESDPTDTPPVTPSPMANPDATDTTEPEATANPTPTPTTGPQIDGILPEHRVLSYYGHPSTGDMGILGEYSKEEVLQRLREQGAAYEAADPDTPVKLAFEIIATVAQPTPGSDGTYLLYTGDDWIGEYVDFAIEHDLEVILDLQIGHSTIREEMERISHWLTYPNVHIALDPEFSTAPDWAPGESIGQVDGNHVQIAVEIMSQIVREHDLPSKMLIVHQFDRDMIFNKGAIEPLPGVDVVLDVDGFGTPEAKIGDYNHFVRQELIEYGGIKLFYKQDSPLMSPEDVVSLQPPPKVVIYQ